MTKRVSVSQTVDLANQYLAHINPTMTKDTRQGVIFMIDEILHKTGNYAGFRYLSQDEVVGDLPGVRLGPNGSSLEYDERFKDTDDTRRQYGCKSV